MVCIYCNGNLSVINSRAQRRKNQTWRRRKCENCGAIFTAIEGIDLASAVAVQTKAGLKPFSRDKLFISIYESCRHRKQAAHDASGLTETIIAKLLPQIHDGRLPLDAIISSANDVLHRFDNAAAVQYSAYHPLTEN